VRAYQDTLLSGEEIINLIKHQQQNGSFARTLFGTSTLWSKELLKRSSSRSRRAKPAGATQSAPGCRVGRKATQNLLPQHRIDVVRLGQFHAVDFNVLEGRKQLEANQNELKFVAEMNG
jgi:hypothetical protein